MKSTLTGKLPLLVGHRGASYRAPENTMPSYHLAWKEGALCVEGDFWLTADERIVCLHDPTTGRTSPKQKILDVREAEYSEIVKYDVGAWKSPEYAGTTIPLLEEILQEMPEDGGIYIEIKQNTPRIVHVMLDIISASKIALSQVTLISFSSAILKQAGQIAPEMKSLLLYDHEEPDVDGTGLLSADELVSLAKDVGAKGLDLGMSSKVDAELVRKMRDADLEFHVWTVNSLEDALHYIELGVDSLTTDRPQGLREELEKSI